MTTHKANQRLAGDLNVILRDAEALLKATANATGENMKDAQSRLRSALESAKATCQRVKEKTVAAAKGTDHVIREHPYHSIGVALGIGLLIGALVKRRS